VELLAKSAIGGVLHHRHPAWRQQAELVAVAAVDLRIGAQRGAHVVGHAIEAIGLDVQRERVGGVLHVLLEALRQRSQPILDLEVALSRRPLELRTGKHEVAQRVGERAPPRRIEAFGRQGRWRRYLANSR
jgi:hypothetical protein